MQVHGLVYEDIVLVDRQTGEVDPVVEQLSGPTDILADSNGNLLIANYDGSIWRLSTTQAAVPLMDIRTRVLLVVLMLGTVVLMRWSRAQC